MSYGQRYSSSYSPRDYRSRDCASSYSSGAASSYGSYGRSHGYGSRGSDTSSMRSYSSNPSSYKGHGDSWRTASYSAPRDSSLSFASLNRGNVFSLRDRFNQPSAQPTGGRYLARSISQPRSEYGGGARTSGYASDLDVRGSTRSYGSYLAPPSRYGRSSSISHDYTPSTRVYGAERKSRMDYGTSRARPPPGPRTAHNYSTRSSIGGGTSYTTSAAPPTQTKTAHQAVAARTRDYNLTPFSSRRTTKTSDTNLTPFTSRFSRQTSVPVAAPQERRTLSRDGQRSLDTQQSNESTETIRHDRVGLSVGIDDSSDSAHEPDGGNRDPDIRYLTSRATSPMEVDRDDFQLRSVARRKRRRFISRTKTKIYPKKKKVPTATLR